MSLAETLIYNIEKMDKATTLIHCDLVKMITNGAMNVISHTDK